MIANFSISNVSLQSTQWTMDQAMVSFFAFLSSRGEAWTAISGSFGGAFGGAILSIQQFQEELSFSCKLGNGYY
jgi:hypothetical protein